jgi:hypothetical protein
MISSGCISNADEGVGYMEHLAGVCSSRRTDICFRTYSVVTLKDLLHTLHRLSSNTGKTSPYNLPERSEKEKGYSYTLSLTSSLRERPGTHCTRDWLGPRVCLFWLARKISPSPNFDRRTVQPVAGRYTDWDIPANFRQTQSFKKLYSFVLSPF